MQKPFKIEKSKPDTLWVSQLTRVSETEAEKYVFEAANDSELTSHLTKKLPTGGRTNYIQIAAPFELYALARIQKPKHIVEVGVSAGVSSTYFLRALERNGRGTLHSIDLPEKEEGFAIRKASWEIPPGKSSGWAIPKKLKTNWDLRLGKSTDVLPSLERELDSIDTFLYDVPWTLKSAIGDFQIADRKLKHGSIVMADNALEAITWWAKLRRRNVVQRKGLGLRGFSLF